MKIALGAIVNSKAQLEALASNKYSASFTWRLIKIISIVNLETSLFEGARNKLIIALGEEKDGSTRVKDENIAEFHKQVNELMSEVLDIEFPEMSISDLEKLELSVEELFPIAYLLKERDELDEIFKNARKPTPPEQPTSIKTESAPAGAPSATTPVYEGEVDGPKSPAISEVEPTGIEPLKAQ